MFDVTSFAVRFEWQEGSIPPPYHYEYIIQIGPGLEGQFVLRPDYPFNAPPEWSERFPVSAEGLAKLHALMEANHLFDRTWREVITPSVGGHVERLSVTMGGRTYSFPRQLDPEDAGLMSQVIEAVQAFVPETLWRELMIQREAYQQAYFRKQSIQGGTP